MIPAGRLANGRRAAVAAVIKRVELDE